jgi:toxin ParE1/3/4
VKESTVFEVEFDADAVTDLNAIADYLAANHSAAAAGAFVTEVVTRIEALATFPFRGAVPRELEIVGRRQYRQIVFPPYRILYRVADATVTIVLVADGRRDMQSLLDDRLLNRDRPI